MQDRLEIRNAPVSSAQRSMRGDGSRAVKSCHTVSANLESGWPKSGLMDRLARATIVTCLLAAIPLLAQNGAPPQHPPHQASTKAAPASNPDRGQQVFEQNCSRCHNAPDGFSPRISGTIARHMRVRANLSDADFKALVNFLNP
jgi:mono/diheme cytochrome c family protein